MKAFLSLVTVLACTAPAVMAQSSAQPAAPATHDKAPWWVKDGVITQTGSVFIEIPANRASFSGTFLSVDKTVEAAQAKAIAQSRAVQDTLAKLGKDQVQVTTGFSMRALYEQYRDRDGNVIDNERGDKIRGYEVSLTLSVKVRDLSKLEKAYSLMMAAAPSSATDIQFSLQPDAAMITWLDTEAVKDARRRATDAAVASGATLGALRLIDPTGRACAVDILAPAPQEPSYAPGYNDEVSADASSDDEVVVKSLRRVPGVTVNRFNMDGPGTTEYIEAQALKNPFLQTPPLVKRTATACVVYSLN